MKVAVIGAGSAGLTAAYQLAKSGVQVEVFEAGPSVGGLAKTLDLWGQKVDLGPHRFFSKDKRVNELWLEVVQNDYEMIDRMTRIFYKGKFYSYPLQPFDALGKLGLGYSLSCIFSFLKEKVFPTRQDGSFENWVVLHFGRRLFETFFRSYSEKLWGISCKDLDADFAAQRIRKLSLFQAIQHAFVKNKALKHRTLADQFAYPHGGTGMVYERMAQYVLRREGKIHLKTPIQRVLTEGHQAVALELPGGEIRPFDHIISTMPLTALVSRLPDITPQVKDALKTLMFRNTVFVYLNVASEHLFPDQWIYIQSPELKAGRVTNFRNWVPQLYGKEKNTIVAMEYWCNDEDALWKGGDASLIELAERELRSIGLEDLDFKVLEGYVHRLPKSYPVYRRGYKEKLKIVEEHLDTVQKLTPIGRYGSFKYNNQDHSILMGILAAENIAAGGGYNLWDINNNYEDYQEAFLIQRTGLVKR